MSRRPFFVVTNAGKAVSSSVLAQYATKEEGSRRLTAEFTKTDYGAGGLVAPLYDPDRLISLLELNTYHYRACKTKARDAAGLGWDLVPDGDEDDRPAEVEELQGFLEELATPLGILLEQAQMDFEAIGWGCLELVHEDFDPAKPLKDITQIPGHTVRVHKSGDKYCQRRGRKKVWFRRPGHVVTDAHRRAGLFADAAVGATIHVDFETGAEGTGIPPQRRGSTLLFWRNYTPRSDYYGLPDVIPAIGAITGEVARRDYNIAFFENFGVPAYAVSIVGDFEDEDVLDDAGNPTGVTVLQQAIEEKLQELQRNPHSTLVLSIPTKGGSGEGAEVAVHFEKLATDVKEASFRLYRQDNRDEVLAAHAVPPYRAAIAETGALGQNVAAETTEIYKRSVIEPRQTTLELLINRWIVRPVVEDWRLKLAEIDTTDEKHELDMLKGLWDLGAIVAREARRHFAERFGLDPDAPLPEDLGAEPAEVEEAVRSLTRTILERAEKAGLIEASEREMFEREFAGAEAA